MSCASCYEILQECSHSSVLRQGEPLDRIKFWQIDSLNLRGKAQPRPSCLSKFVEIAADPEASRLGRRITTQTQQR